MKQPLNQPNKYFRLAGRLVYALFFVLNIETYAQQEENRLISGVIKDAGKNTTLPGANVYLKGTQKGTVSNSNGEYSINVPKNSILVFSYLGYYPIEVVVGNQSTINVQMTESTKSLNELVVIGYGSTIKKEVTGSIASVKPEEFNRGVFSDAIGLIQGKIAGLSIRKPSGSDPQAGYEIILRGTNTLTSGQGPLVIIDGVAGADIRNVNFNEVLSVDVLKDGSAAAIYGTRGTNGVIIITTKRAKQGKPLVEYSSHLTGQIAPRGVRTLSADEFKTAIEKYAPDKAGSIYSAKTDWFKEITRTLPLSQRHNLALSGGSETFFHRTNISTEQSLGLLKDNEYNRYLFKTNIKQNAFDNHLELDFNLIVGLRQYQPANYDLFYQAFIQNPTQPIYDASNLTYGGYSSLPGIEYYNPVAMLKERQRNGKTNDVSPNFRASLRLFDALTIVNFLSFEQSSWENTGYRTKYYPTRIGSNGVADISNGSSQNLQYESTINYSLTRHHHNIQAVGGYSFLESNFYNNALSNSGFDTDIYGPFNIGAGTALTEGRATMSSWRESSKLIAFFGRATYNYNGKYLLSLSLRREGSSRFGKNNKWGSFPAISIGWRISQEGFMNDLSWVNELKLRLGYGVTGNQDFANYKSLVLMGRAGKFFYNGAWINTYQPVSNPNPDLKWEKKKEFNAGFDFSFINNKLSGSFDYYFRTSTDLLYTYNVAVPPYLFKELFTNVGAIRNTGLELGLNWLAVKKSEFIWNTHFTISANRNKLIKFSNEEFTNKYIDIGWIGGAIPQNSQRIQEGQSLGNFFGPVWLKVDDSGFDKFKNANPIGKVDPEKWEVMGNAYPILSMGWGNSFSYKNWEANLAFRTQIGGKVLNLYRLYFENWQNIGTRNIVYSQYENPRFIGNAIYSSKYVEDATFLKLDNIAINYHLPVSLPYISNFRLTLNAQNVFTITKYQGLDPEVNLSGLTPGIDPLSYYPRTTSITIGINMTL